MEYDFKVIHRSGKSHTNADALSRLPRPCLVSEYRHCLRYEQREEDTTANVRVVRDTDIESKSLSEQQLADSSDVPVLKWKELGQRTSWADVSAMSEDVKIYWAQWDIHPDARGDIVLWQFILLKTERAAILRQLHEEPTGGHLGGIKTLGKVR